MAAVAAALSRERGRRARVWAPDYFCDQALWPLRHEGVDLTFYPIDRQLNPDWERMDRSVPPPDIFIHVHYFGHVSDTSVARQFCDAHHALLIEDCTHVLGPSPGIGEDGDVVVYSPWKFLQIPNGAWLLIRPRAAERANEIALSVSRLGTSAALGLRWLKNIAVRKPEPDFVNDHLDDPAVTPMAVRPRPSPVSRPFLARVDLQAMAAKRRNNDAAIRAALGDIRGWTPLFSTPAPAPMRSAWLADTPERARVAYAALRRLGVEVEGWPVQPPEARDPVSWATRLRSSALYLPCHDAIDISALLAALDRAGLRDLALSDAGASRVVQVIH